MTLGRMNIPNILKRVIFNDGLDAHQFTEEEMKNLRKDRKRLKRKLKRNKKCLK